MKLKQLYYFSFHISINNYGQALINITCIALYDTNIKNNCDSNKILLYSFQHFIQMRLSYMGKSFVISRCFSMTFLLIPSEHSVF